MEYFQYVDGRLYVEEADVAALAKEYSTPCFIYSQAALADNWNAFDQAFAELPHLVCYAVKANANLAVLNTLARLGSGFDIVSIGELERVIAAGGAAEKIVFSGVGKRQDEIKKALDVGIACFHVESSQELDRIDEIAGSLGLKAPISLRVNPDVNAQTHPYISTGLKENKFGIHIDEAFNEYLRASSKPNIDITGISFHIGSQLIELEPILDSLERILDLIARLRQQGINIRNLDIGGGLGINYQDEIPPSPKTYVTALLTKLKNQTFEKIIIEPGRAIVGNAGLLLTTVEFIKHTDSKNFAIVDAGMNDLLRPSLYQAWQKIIPIICRHDQTSEHIYDVVGPICETGDFLGKQRLLKICAGDLLAVLGCGAYAFAMSSTYNSRPLAAEVMVHGEKSQIVRERGTYQQLMAGESIMT